jgi:DNA primase
MKGLDAVKHVKANIKISQVIRARIEVTQQGSALKARCPFHQERTPSFSINDDGGYYHCFGCGAHGDAIDFVANFDGIPFKEALKTVAAEAGIVLEQEYRSGHDSKLQQQYELMARLSRWFTDQLWSSAQGSAALEYLRMRGVKDETIAAFDLGFCPKNGVDAFLKQHKYAAEPNIAKDGRLFSGRLMFPIFDKEKRVIAFGARTLTGQGAKYVNSSESTIFKKSECLYGLELGKTLRAETIFAVEGYMDSIALHQVGIKNNVATMGTAFGAERVVELWRGGVKQVNICFDGDGAGMRAMKKLALDLLQHIHSAECLVNFIILPQDSDPADIAFGGGALPEPCDMADIIWDSVVANFDHSKPGIRARTEHKLGKLVERIPSTMVRKSYQRYFNDKLFWLSAHKKKSAQKSAAAPPAPLTTMSLADIFCQLEIAAAIVYPEVLTGAEEDFFSVTAPTPALNKMKDFVAQAVYSGLQPESIMAQLGAKFSGAGTVASFVAFFEKQKYEHGAQVLGDLIALRGSIVRSSDAHAYREARAAHDKIRSLLNDLG